MKPNMTRDEWQQRAFGIDAIRTLASAYSNEHDWDADEDPSATSELLAEVDSLYAKLMAELGPPPEPCDVPDPETADCIPF